MAANSSEHPPKEDMQKIIADVGPIYLIFSYQN